ncbi:hypothetical protein L1987_21216 [Smallanthus sonchifolius]|uniref:Uncharacterized protein n=1 Tax=Smallanthus sonchifolius TaxID=185202 RepID=A0ACB9ITR7_9ASTR|nr:hypothetical protein L1987_21216 [Smallanthus sonchifolius]
MAIKEGVAFGCHGERKVPLWWSLVRVFEGADAMSPSPIPLRGFCCWYFRILSLICSRILSRDYLLILSLEVSNSFSNPFKDSFSRLSAVKAFS